MFSFIEKTITGVIFCMFVISSPAFANNYKWDMPNEFQATSLHAKNDIYFAKILKEKSKNQIEIIHHFGGSIGYKGITQFDGVSDGDLVLANTYVGSLRGIDPIFLTNSLPFLARTVDEAKVLWELSRPYYEKVLEKQNQVLLYAAPWTPSGIWSKNAVKTIDDLKRLKIRTYDPNGTITFKKANATPVQLAWSDIIPQLTTGGINSVLTSAEAGRNLKMWDHLSNYNEVIYAIPLNMIHINRSVFNSLPADLKNAIMDTAKETNEFAWNSVKNQMEQNYKDLKANNVQLITKPSTSVHNLLSESAQEAIDSWLDKTGSYGEQLLIEYRNHVGR